MPNIMMPSNQYMETNNHQVIQTNYLSMSKNNLIYVCSKIIRKSYNQNLSTNRSQKAYKHQVIQAFKSTYTNFHTKSKTTFLQQCIHNSYQKHTNMQTKRQSNHQSHRHMHNDHTNTHSINHTKLKILAKTYTLNLQMLSENNNISIIYIHHA